MSLRRALWLAPAALALACAGGRAPQASTTPPVSTTTQAPVESRQPAPPDPEREPRPWDAATAWRSSAGTYVVRFRSAPEPLPDNEDFTLDVWVFDVAWPDQPLGDVQLSVDAEMPQHGHGMNLRPKVEPGADGRFHVTGMLFHMTGEWQLYFDVTRGAITERAQYELVLE